MGRGKFGNKIIDSLIGKKDTEKEKNDLPVIPRNIKIINVTSDTVELSWDLVDNETSWEVVIQKTNNDKPAFETGTYTSSNKNYREIGLHSSVDYEVYIRVNNSNESIWAPPVKFKTLSPVEQEKPITPNFREEEEKSIFGDAHNPESFNTQNLDSSIFNNEELPTQETANHENQIDSIFGNEQSQNTNLPNNNRINNAPLPKLPKSQKTVEITIDPEYVYFFTFGLTTAGKTAMLSGVLYYMETSRIGRLRPKGDKKHQKRGKMILNQMRRKVKSGKFVNRSPTMDATDANLPTEINLKFEPTDSNKPDMPFCLMEMSGEDLKEIKLTEDINSGDFDDRIKAYLTHPKCMLAFICVIDTDLGENGISTNPREESEDIIMEFLDYLHDIGHKTNPILISVNKWDKISDSYDNVDNYLKEEHPLLYGAIADRDRVEVAVTKFSIGDVDDEGATYEYIPDDSKTIFHWMYRIATNVSFDEENASEGSKSKKRISLKERLSHGFKNMISDE